MACVAQQRLCLNSLLSVENSAPLRDKIAQSDWLNDFVKDCLLIVVDVCCVHKTLRKVPITPPPSLSQTFCLKWEISIFNVVLGEGWVGSFLECYTYSLTQRFSSSSFLLPSLISCSYFFDPNGYFFFLYFFHSSWQLNSQTQRWYENKPFNCIFFHSLFLRSPQD